MNNIGQAQLVLSLLNVGAALNNTEFVCEVDVVLATGLTTIRKIIIIQRAEQADSLGMARGLG